MTRAVVIAVDGPAAAGKGTLAKSLAEALGLPHLDTGLLYRAVARKMLDDGRDPEKFSGLEQAERLLPSDLKRSDLRTPEVDRGASLVARQKEVRAALVAVQRRFAAESGAVLDGRDIGTVIFPDAPVKLFVTASVEARARRRLLQVGGDPSDAAKLAEVAAALHARDEADASRATAPLKMAEDAVLIVTDDLDAQDVLRDALRIVRERIGG